MKLMIVEDDEQMRRLIRSFVARLADQICEGGDGLEALAAYAARRPDRVMCSKRIRTPGAGDDRFRFSDG